MDGCAQAVAVSRRSVSRDIPAVGRVLGLVVAIEEVEPHAGAIHAEICLGLRETGAEIVEFYVMDIANHEWMDDSVQLARKLLAQRIVRAARKVLHRIPLVLQAKLLAREPDRKSVV